MLESPKVLWLKCWYHSSWLPLGTFQRFYKVCYTPICLKDYKLLKSADNGTYLPPTTVWYWARDLAILDFGVNSVKWQWQLWSRGPVNVVLGLRTVVLHKFTLFLKDLSKEDDMGKYILQLGDAILWEGTEFHYYYYYHYCSCKASRACKPAQLIEATQLLLDFSHRENTGLTATPLWKWPLPYSEYQEKLISSGPV